MSTPADYEDTEFEDDFDDDDGGGGGGEPDGF